MYIVPERVYVEVGQPGAFLKAMQRDHLIHFMHSPRRLGEKDVSGLVKWREAREDATRRQ